MRKILTQDLTTILAPRATVAVTSQVSGATSRRGYNINLNCINATTIKDYDIQCLIGQGAFGVV